MKKLNYNETASKYDAMMKGLKKPDENEAQEWNDNLSGEIDYLIPFDCIARDIQQWILSSSIYPQPAISFAATMSFLGAMFGRSIAYENIKGNLMYICMAESGEGKDKPFKAIKLLANAIGKGNVVKSSKYASGAALMESLQDTPSMLFHVDEFGNYLASINGKNSNQYSKEIVDIMTECYTCCDSVIYGKALKGKEPIRVDEPNLCVLALSTERQIFDGLKTSDLANGSIARYSMLFGINYQLPRNIEYSEEIPDKIINRLKEMVEHESKKRILFKKSEQIKRSKEYNDYKFEMVKRMKEKSNSLEGEKRNFIPMYNRIAVRCIQQAMLIDGCQSIDVLKWIENIELKSFDVFMKKFLHLGSDNEMERCYKIIERAIKEAGKNGITKNKFYAKTRQLDPGMKQRMLKELIDSNSVFEKKGEQGVKGFAPTIYYWKK
ncbi:MAG: hypothetical protein WC465_04975 [Patescibacteria group bacterium]